jgi:hypothetical protein
MDAANPAIDRLMYKKKHICGPFMSKWLLRECLRRIGPAENHGLSLKEKTIFDDSKKLDPTFLA